MRRAMPMVAMVGPWPREVKSKKIPALTAFCSIYVTLRYRIEP
jgi:hypothetical protein